MTIAELLIEELSERMSQNEIETLKTELQIDYNNLINIYNNMNTIGTSFKIKNTALKQQSALSKILKSQNNSSQAQTLVILNEEQFEEQDMKKFSTLGAQAYELTAKILQTLRLNPEYHITVSYSTPSGKKFYRQSNFKLTEEYTTGEVRHKYNKNGQIIGNYLSIKLKTTKINQELRKYWKDKKDLLNAISKHYQDFSNIFITKNWRPKNLGIVAEAFERHWEIQKHTEDPKNLKQFNKKINKAEAWKLYLLSGGRDPYYTGPDTEDSQVKKTNASLISDINTVLNTILAIKNMFTEEIMGGVKKQQQKLKEYKNAFKSKNTFGKIDEELEAAILESLEKEELPKIFNKFK